MPVLAATAAGVDLDSARAFLAEHGAVMLKAVAGGGGRGMRPVSDPSRLEDAFAACTREAEAAFGNGALYAEELLPAPVTSRSRSWVTAYGSSTATSASARCSGPARS